MNVFQQKLLALTNEMRRASERVCESETVSVLDVEVLRQRMREMYDFLLTADYQQTISQPSFVKEEVLEIQPKIEQVIVEEKPLEIVPEVKEEIVESVEPKQEEIIELPKIEQVEIEPEKIEQQEEKIEVKEEVLEIKEEIIEVKEEIIEIKPERVEPTQEMPKTIEPEIVFEAPEPKSEPTQAKTGSVLDYLHNNIMKDSEPKSTKKEAASTLDLFKTPQSIADKFENKNRSDLRTAIGVGEKFMFINDLFSGDLKAYTNFINILNEATSLEMSMIVIEENRNKRKWIKNSLAYSTLENLVEKRFKK